jgi:cell wall-associated NlpC family hydrolase
MTAALDALIVKEAMSWVGTPFVHGASVKGSGCDCLGLIKGVYENVFSCTADALPVYPETFWQDAVWHTLFLNRLHKVAGPSGTGPEAGRLLLFAKNGILTHLGLGVDAQSMIHTSSDPRVGRVCHAPVRLVNGLSLWGVWSFRED